MAHQVRIWEGEFGDAYTDRNVLDYRTRLSAFRSMLSGLLIKRVLEVGCNRGHNLVTLTEILGVGSEIAGVEPNWYALGLAKALRVLQGHALDLPFKEGYFDLVFTVGVLIHVKLSDLAGTLAEIYRVSSHYILAIEYFAEEETAIPYHGHNDMLWKRDFLAHYRSQFPSLMLIRRGYWGPENGFDNSTWWLFEKEGVRYGQ